MNKQIFVLPLVITMVAQGNAQEKECMQPNVVFILADDMGIGDLGCYGQCLIKTPHIDALASNGVLFENHYSGSTVSAPSRCCLMTGKHTGHSYVRGNKGVESEQGVFDLHLPESETTVAELFKEKGYATMCVGKWGLGGPGTSGSPIKQGFDYFFGYLSQAAAHRYYPDYLYENEEKVWLRGNVYSHFVIMEKGLDFIRTHKDAPFFAYFSITPPHADLDYPDLSQYDGLFEEKPFINEKGSGFKTQHKPRAAYASMVSEVDNNVGQILALLKELELEKNTLVIFASDNGVHCVGGHDPEYFDSNGPYRGYKRDLYEGGIHVPFIVSWPAVITEPRVTTHTSTFWDFLPTICDLIGTQVPEGIDGISYLPVLKNCESEQRKHDYLYYEFYEQGGKQAILKDGWKLIRLNLDEKKPLIEELYYIKEDVGEKYNLINLHSEKAEMLREKIPLVRSESDWFSWKKNR